MYIKEHEFMKIKVLTKRKALYLKKLLNIDIEIGLEYNVHWSFLKKSSLRRNRIKVMCDKCNKIIEKRLQDINIDVNLHFCKSCAKYGEKNPMFGLKGKSNPNYGSKRPTITGENNTSKNLEIRQKISIKNRLTNDEFFKRLEEKNILKYDYDFSLLEYINTNIPIKIICKKHGIFEVKPRNLMTGTICPLCKNSSIGENKIENILIRENIKYIKQKTFKDCRGIKRPLPFDFYLPNHNICIEYDGRQHHEPVEKFGAMDGFNELIKNDTIKNKYCELNNIKLLRISYKNNIDSFIESILL